MQLIPVQSEEVDLANSLPERACKKLVQPLLRRIHKLKKRLPPALRKKLRHPAPAESHLLSGETGVESHHDPLGVSEEGAESSKMAETALERPQAGEDLLQGA